MTPEYNPDQSPIYIGELIKPFGLNGFERADIGHPVFELKDRYVIFLKCLTKTLEQIPDGNGGHVKTFIEFNSMIPFYKNTLKENIKFINL